MGRFGSIVVLVVSSTAAFADRDEPPFQLEAGINTRHFGADVEEGTALRGEAMESASEAQAAVTADLRFTRWTRWNTFLGIEAEIGKLTTHEGSNLAATYGITGARFDLGRAIVAVELASGWRTVRYSLGDKEHGKLVFEPRARAQLWATSRVTVGAALGATIGTRDVFMAGIYVGVHSLVDGRKQP